MKLSIINKGDLHTHIHESVKRLNLMFCPLLLKFNSEILNAGTFYLGVYITSAYLEKLDKEEQFAAIDHELGHRKRWKEDIFFIIYLILPLPFMVYTISDLLVPYLLFRFVRLNVWQYTLPLLFLFLILRFFKLDYMVGLKIKAELEADKISAALGNAKALISSLKKIEECNRDKNTSKILTLIYHFYFSTLKPHPTTEERIKKIEKFL